MEKTAKIETQKQFDEWMKLVNANFSNSKHKMCDLQDIFARSHMGVLKTLFVNMANKNLAVFTIQKAMGGDCLFEFVRDWAKVSAQKIVEQDKEKLNLRWSIVLEKEVELAKIKDGLNNKIAYIESELSHARANVRDLEAQMDKAAAALNSCTII